MYLVFPQNVLPGRHHAVAPVGDGLFDHLTGAAIEPDVVGEIRCAEGDAALGIRAVAGGAHGKACFPFLGFHLINPRDVVPESNMPAFPWLETNVLSGELTGKKLALFRDHFGVPYTDADIAGAGEAVKGKTELDALIAYLQSLGHALK